MTYRADIDGLRAVAVLSVVLYHAGALLPGGFGGVDIFFVISGYLITGLISEEVRSNCFSFVAFYERRIRRLLPAMLVVIAATTFGAMFLLMPGDLVNFGRDLIATALLGANVSLWQRSTYFAAAAELNPLLHLWSLAIEEQFYLLLPVMLYFGLRWRPRMVLPVVVAVLLISLWLSQAHAMRGTATGFFLLPYRAWELLIGSLLALALPLKIERQTAEILSLAGIVAMAASLTLYTSSTPFPGLAAVLPCAGAAMIIAAGACHPTLVNRALSLGPMVGIGRVSYAFYLYHWPPLALAKYYLMRPLTRTEALVIIAWALVAAVISTRTIEQGYRYGAKSSLAVWRFGAAGASAMVMMGVGAASILAHGFPKRLDSEALRLVSFTDVNLRGPYRGGHCFLDAGDTIDRFDPVRCASRSGGRPALALWGDSLAAHYYPGFEAEFGDVDILQFTAGSCPPILDFRKRFPAHCRSINAEFFRQIAETRPDVVVLSARWAQHLDVLEQLDATLNRLVATGTQVILLTQGLEFTAPLPIILARAARRGRLAQFDPVQFLSREPQRVNAIFNSRYAARDGVRLIALLPLLCDPVCPTVTVGHVPIFPDQSHLIPEASREFARRLRPQIEQSLNRKGMK